MDNILVIDLSEAYCDSELSFLNERLLEQYKWMTEFLEVDSIYSSKELNSTKKELVAPMNIGGFWRLPVYLSIESSKVELNPNYLDEFLKYKLASYLAEKEFV